MKALNRYLRILTIVDLLIFFALFTASALTEKFVCQWESIPIPYFGRSNKTQEYVHHTSIWDLRKQLLENALLQGPEAYHLLYLTLILILVAYFVVEIWLFCLLFQGLDKKRESSIMKWTFCRVIITGLTVAIGLVEDFNKHQTTCTNTFFFPFSLLRIIFVMVVHSFMMSIRNVPSHDTIIIMTGSEKIHP